MTPKQFFLKRHATEATIFMLLVCCGCGVSNRIGEKDKAVPHYETVLACGHNGHPLVSLQPFVNQETKEPGFQVYTASEGPIFLGTIKLPSNMDPCAKAVGESCWQECPARDLAIDYLWDKHNSPRHYYYALQEKGHP
jgi:hypothetical protein